MIVQKSMIHRNTFYNHFEDKYDLLKKFFKNLIKKRITQDKMKLFPTQPFYVISIIIKPISKIFAKQNSSDISNRETFSSIFSKEFSNYCIQNSNIDEVAWVVGRVMGIIFWENYLNWPLDINHDYKELDHIFNTEKFPKIKD